MIYGYLIEIPLQEQFLIVFHKITLRPSSTIIIFHEVLRKFLNLQNDL